ncbi:dynamin-binding protein [Crotalus adamanteus]|uniref:Dynamin-binding protein n=1 Tax=Crotalus adamanteus TaxID=8729 RepID=A0AAW1BGQ0_CROAD
METGSLVRAVFDFCPSVSEELPLFVGDIIEVLAVIDEFWLFGKKEGVTGQFPSSFVEPVDVPVMNQGEKLFVCISNFTSQEPGSLALQRGDLVILNDSIASPWLKGRSSWGASGFFPSSCVRELSLSGFGPQFPHGATLEMPSYALGQARALMSLSAQMEEELDFREGDVIIIVGIPEPGWFEGEIQGRRGIFPEGFVELLGPLKTNSNPDELTSSEIPKINGMKDTYPQEKEKSWSDEVALPGPYGIALYRFQALESAELDFEVGERIRILGVLEDGWLEGELRGKCGIFPHRFVKTQYYDQLDKSEPIQTPQTSWDHLKGCKRLEQDGEAHSLIHQNILCEDLVVCTDRQQQKPKSHSSSFSGTQESLDIWPVCQGTQNEVPQGVNHGEICGDLDSKLTEQLAQFEQSLTNPIDHGGCDTIEQDNIARHFSILDFSCERDIVRGTVENTSQRRKVLRPPPPRPVTPVSASPPVPVRLSPSTASIAQSIPPSMRPSRPAPLPPLGSQRKSPTSIKQQLESRERKGNTVESGRTSPCPFLLNRIQELEQELDFYRKTRTELNETLEQPQDEVGQAETLENLDLCDCKMSSLCLELQELKGEYCQSCREYKDYNFVKREKISKEHRQDGGSENWKSEYRNRDLYSTIRPVKRVCDHFKKEDSRYRVDSVSRNCKDYVEEDKQSVDQRKMNLYFEHETGNNGYLEEDSYYTDFENNTQVVHKKSFVAHKGHVQDAQTGAWTGRIKLDGQVAQKPGNGTAVTVVQLPAP